MQSFLKSKIGGATSEESSVAATLLQLELLHDLGKRNSELCLQSARPLQNRLSQNIRDQAKSREQHRRRMCEPPSYRLMTQKQQSGLAIGVLTPHACLSSPSMERKPVESLSSSSGLVSSSSGLVSSSSGIFSSLSGVGGPGQRLSWYSRRSAAMT